MTPLPEGLVRRSATRADVSAIHQLGVACDIQDHGSSDFDEQDVTSEWDRPGFDLAKDTWLLESAGLLVGFASIYPEGPPDTYEGYGFVHPEHRGRGIGSFLLDVIDERALELAGRRGSFTLHTFAPSTDEDAKALIEARKFTPVRRFWRMAIDLRTEARLTQPPEGLEIRIFDMERDGPAAHALMERVFEGSWGFEREPYEVWHRHWTESRPFDASLSLVAYDGDRLAGASLNLVRIGEGFIGDLGVDESYRGRGLGAFLLLRSFDIFRDRGYTQVMLSVDADNETNAPRLYERVGMRVTRQYDIYEKVVRA